MRRSHLRAQLRRLKIKTLAIGVVIGFKILALLNDIIRHTHRFQIITCGVVGCDQPHLGPHLGTHVGEGHALLHTQTANGVACKFNCLVVTTIHAKLANHVQHHVFGTNTFLKCAMPNHSERLRHLHPNFTRGHHAQHFSGANAKHVGPKGATRWRMRVATNTKIPRLQMAALRQHHMANTFRINHVGKLPLFGHIACDANDFFRIGVSGRHIVIEHQHHFVAIPNFSTDLCQHGLQTTRPRRVMKHGQIDLASEHVAHVHMGLACGTRNEFLRQRRT